MISEATETAPTAPGVYKMPCGECVVDFFLNAEGQERWLVAGPRPAGPRRRRAVRTFSTRSRPALRPVFGAVPRCGASGPRSAAVRALLGDTAPRNRRP